MSVRKVGFTAAIMAAAAASGCSSRPDRIEPLPATPVAAVQSRGLQPIEPLPPTETAVEAETEAPEMASLPPEATALSIERTDLLGGWAVSSGGETCQLFMSLTQWTGGYRASTRGCASPTLSAISAWDLSGKQIQLKGEEGAPIATLLAADQTRFTGSLAGGGAITVQR